MHAAVRSQQLALPSGQGDSHSALEWLSEHGVGLGGVTQLGGHSVPRTHTVAAGANVGWAIMSQLTAAVRAEPRIQVRLGLNPQHCAPAAGDSWWWWVAAAEVRRSAPCRGLQVLEGVALAALRCEGDRVVGAQLRGQGGKVRRAARWRGGRAPSLLATCESLPHAAGSTTPLSCTRTFSSARGQEWEVAVGALVLATGGFAANRELLRVEPGTRAWAVLQTGAWARVAQGVHRTPRACSSLRRCPWLWFPAAPQRVAPDTADLPTTNGPWAQGDGLQLAEAVGAHLASSGGQDAPHVAPLDGSAAP
jgi:hypothetical protein